MKKTSLIIVAFIICMFVISGINSVYAIDLNLINSVRQNEITSSENLTLNNTTNEYVEEDNGNDTLYEDFFNDTLEEDDTINTSTVISNVTTTESETLTIGNILSILLLVVGVLLILLGIAIMIRMNR